LAAHLSEDIMAVKSVSEKFENYRDYFLYKKLNDDQKLLIKTITFNLSLTFQEFRQIVEICRDLEMWGEEDLSSWWINFNRLSGNYSDKREQKKNFLTAIQKYISDLKTNPKHYEDSGYRTPVKPEKSKVIIENTDSNVFGWCPVASEKTVCCNLRTIDAVESCAFGCSYCTIQTFYRDRVVIDNNLAEKLEKIKLDPGRRYHIGTGQSSDSLVWGNRNGMLDNLMTFVRRNPNVLLEFKTKSDNIEYFLNNDIPENIVCSWSLNPQIIIDHEEHYTASLERRLNAARVVADIGIKVSFHFHPIIYYQGWKEAYSTLAETILSRFRPEEILFISFGSVTFIKPVIKKIRERGLPTKILKMEFTTDPHGKLTYTDAIKVEKFSTMYETFKSWHDKVFFYLCMEKALLWEKSFGYVYETNEAFEQALIESSFSKITPEIPG
jgi:spore photoproduct lyase